jgi:hypothetical protein
MKLPRRSAHIAAILFSLLLIFPSAAVVAQAPSGGWTLRLPSVQRDFVPNLQRVSRFGFGAAPIESIHVRAYPTYTLNAGWYLDWTSRRTPIRPGGISFVHVVGLSENGAPRPSGSALEALVRANPGALWLIGNEPDSPAKDAVTPARYAEQYHEVYHLIKGIDPTAVVSAGGIAQPTPLRIRYLEAILAAYQQRYGTKMPVDVWNTHAYFLPEIPEEEAGLRASAYLPVGISDEANERVELPLAHHVDVGLIKDMIVWFREFMARNGYGDCPLIITEMGFIIEWQALYPDQATADAHILAFIDELIGYLLTATDAEIGYRHDGNRLVQRWAWFALTKTGGGELFSFDPETRTPGPMTVHGQRYAALAAAQPRTVNLKPVDLTAASTPRVGEETRLQAKLINNGEVPTPRRVAVRFFDGDPTKGGVQIGATQYTAPIDGGAGMAIVTVPWTPAASGDVELFVAVDSPAGIHETDEGDNLLSVSVAVAG